VRGKCRVVDRETPYVNDSGAQYLGQSSVLRENPIAAQLIRGFPAHLTDGTIDTTRTWHFGTPTDEQKDAFTRVLQGHVSSHRHHLIGRDIAERVQYLPLAQMAVDTVVFPVGTTGVPMNILARKALWAAGLDFGRELRTRSPWFRTAEC
jgi:Xaa-Pro aminopeptidase